jgi:hypothetical protein
MQVKMSRPALCEKSPRVVIGEVTSVAAEWAPGSAGRIVTRVDVAVSRTLKGPIADTVAIEVPGGTIGEIGLHVEHAPVLALDQRYLLVLVDDGGAWRVNGGELGVVRLGAGQGAEDEELAVASLGSCRAEG